MILEEEAWCSDDYRYSVFTNGYLSRQKFHIILEMKILKNDKVFFYMFLHCRVKMTMCLTFLKRKRSSAMWSSTTCVTFIRVKRFQSRRSVIFIISDTQDLTKLKIDNIPGSPLQPGWYKNWGFLYLLFLYV